LSGSVFLWTITSPNTKSFWQVIMHNLRTFFSKPLRFAHLKLCTPKWCRYVTTDEDWIWYIHIPTKEFFDLDVQSKWYSYSIEYTTHWQVYTTEWSAFIHNFAASSVWIISDIDDTILISNAYSKRKTIRTFFATAFSERQLFPGIQLLFERLNSYESFSPIFYVSNSERQLYNFLAQLFSQHNMPRWPLLLRSRQSVWEHLRPSEKEQHKITQITRIIKSYPHLKRVLIGDAWQNDVITYTKIAKLFPDAIHSLYIRTVWSIKNLDRLQQYVAKNEVWHLFSFGRTTEDILSFMHKNKLTGIVV